MFDAGVIYETAMHARDPHGILKEIFKLFLKKGGKFIEQISRTLSNQKLMKQLLDQKTMYINSEISNSVRCIFKNIHRQLEKAYL